MRHGDALGCPLIVGQGDGVGRDHIGDIGFQAFVGLHGAQTTVGSVEVENESGAVTGVTVTDDTLAVRCFGFQFGGTLSIGDAHGFQGGQDGFVDALGFCVVIKLYAKEEKDQCDAYHAQNTGGGFLCFRMLHGEYLLIRIQIRRK